MPAYVIGHISVKDPAKWATYRTGVPATLGPFKGEILLRGRHAVVLDGSHRHADTVVLRFPDLAAARAWHASAEYQALVPLRRQAAEVDLICYEE